MERAPGKKETMTVREVVERLGLAVLTSGDVGGEQITGGYTSDLLSDVMANAAAGDLWITLQTHKNVVAVAKLKELAGIVIVNERRPDDETVQKADEEGVVVLGTRESAFSISGRLYRWLKKS